MSTRQPIIFCGYDSSKVAGGPIVWLQRLLPDLVAKGFEVHALLMLWDSPDVCVLKKHLEDSAVPIRTLQIDWKVPAERRVRWIIEQAQDIKPAVLVANHVIPAYIASPYLQAFGVKTVGVIHSDDVFYEALIEHFYVNPEWHSPDVIIPVSQHLESSIHHKIPNDVLLKRIPCGCPLPELANHRLQNTGELRVMYAGRIVQEQKRILDLTDAFIAASCSAPGFKFSIFGDGPEQEQVVERLAKANNPNVIFHGSVTPQEIIDQMAQHDAFVLMSDYEGLPIALVEAMACGLVPICLKTRSGSTEIINDRINGLIINDRKASFISALNLLAEDNNLRHQLAANARKTVEEEYSTSINHGRWAKLLAQLSTESETNLRSIKLPSKINLPPVDPRFRGEDTRGRRRTVLWRNRLLHCWSQLKQQIAPRARLRRALHRLRNREF
ncbi:glycosyltransferase family 4 protein [Cerasicoccus frondis]|uniref:glycosyltransferase family 4 protein n=1 Tax=Cerasicoccus frondis TaxID=490090 RepID=UPI002852932B|nr:glycosyltransferase family 4 protein [Cerasicoccus frondis]